MRKNVIIDGRRAQRERTGVGHYINSLLIHWPDRAAAEVALVAGASVPDLDGIRTFSPPSGPLWHIAVAWRVLRSGSLYFSPESLLVPIIVGRRSLLTVHDLTPIDRPDVHNLRNVLVHKFLMPLALRRVRRIIVPTARVLDDLQRLFPDQAHKASIIYEGVRGVPQPELPIEGAEDSRPYVLYVGTVEPRKNVSQLIEAAIDALPPDWALKIVGKIGWLSSADKEKFLSLIESERVEYLGYVPDERLPGLYTHSKLFCYVSSSEGFGLPVVEAMNYGVPVVHSDDPALMEVSGGAGMVVRLNNLDEDLRRAFVEISGWDESKHARFSEGSRRAASRFDWAQASRATASIACDPEA